MNNTKVTLIYLGSSCSCDIISIPYVLLNCLIIACHTYGYSILYIAMSTSSFSVSLEIAPILLGPRFNICSFTAVHFLLLCPQCLVLSPAFIIFICCRSLISVFLPCLLIRSYLTNTSNVSMFALILVSRKNIADLFEPKRLCKCYVFFS